MPVPSVPNRITFNAANGATTTQQEDLEGGVLLSINVETEDLATASVHVKLSIGRPQRLMFLKQEWVRGTGWSREVESLSWVGPHEVHTDWVIEAAVRNETGADVVLALEWVVS